MLNQQQRDCTFNRRVTGIHDNNNTTETVDTAYITEFSRELSKPKVSLTTVRYSQTYIAGIPRSLAEAASLAVLAKTTEILPHDENKRLVCI